MAVGARPAQPEMRGDLAGQAALLQIADRGGEAFSSFRYCA